MSSDMVGLPDEFGLENSELSQGPSLRRNSVARLAENGSRIVVGLFSTIITARVLGPGGKGTLSSLLFVGVLLSYACSLGLGDAATVLTGKRQFTLQRAISASILPVLQASLLGVGLIWLMAEIADWSKISSSILIASAMLPLATYGYLFTAFHNSLERIVYTSALAVVSMVLNLALLSIFLIVWDLGIVGAMLASAISTSGLTIALAVGLKRQRFRFRPMLDIPYLQTALRLGFVIEGTLLITALADRLDLLLVYALSGEVAAGHYSVALTLGSLASYVPGALAYAVFPRVARMDQRQATELIARTARLGISAALIVAVLLAVTIPWLVPMVFGRGFVPSTIPALIVLFGGMLFGVQMILAKSWAAQGFSGLYFGSFAVSLATMVSLDIFLIPQYGIRGAAVASSVASLIGLLSCLRLLHRKAIQLAIRDLLPRKRDFEVLVGYFASLVRARR